VYGVLNRGLDITKDNVAFSSTNAEAAFHTDSSFRDAYPDVVGLLCVRPASGNEEKEEDEEGK